MGTETIQISIEEAVPPERRHPSLVVNGRKHQTCIVNLNRLNLSQVKAPLESSYSDHSNTAMRCQRPILGGTGKYLHGEQKYHSKESQCSPTWPADLSMGRQW